jgi:ribosomal protein L40E
MTDSLDTSDPSGAHLRASRIFEEDCRRCGAENIVWSAPSPLWNMVMRENDINGPIKFADLVCMKCFTELAAEKDITGNWRLTVDPLPEGLKMTTPSGRWWDWKRWLWVVHES